MWQNTQYCELSELYVQYIVMRNKRASQQQLYLYTLHNARHTRPELQCVSHTMTHTHTYTSCYTHNTRTRIGVYVCAWDTDTANYTDEVCCSRYTHVQRAVTKRNQFVHISGNSRNIITRVSSQWCSTPDNGFQITRLLAHLCVLQGHISIVVAQMPRTAVLCHSCSLNRTVEGMPHYGYIIDSVNGSVTLQL